MNFEGLSDKLTHRLTKDGMYSPEQKEVIAYGLETLLLSIAGLALIVVIGLITHAWLPALIAAGFGGTLRRLSGGAHFNTPVKCLVFGAAIYSVIGILANFLSTQALVGEGVLVGILAAVLAFSFILTAILAPVDSEAKPIHSTSLRKKLRLASLGFIGVSAVTLSLSIPLLMISATFGILYQSLTLLPMFNRRR